MRELNDIAQEFGRHPGDPFALATLIHSKGSSYRRPGARMLISETGKTVGSLSGGCLEEEVVQKAMEVLRTGQPALMAFDTRRRFGCNGSLEILVERATYAFLSELFEHVSNRRSCKIRTAGSGDIGSKIVPGFYEQEGMELVQIFEPCPHLLVIGSGPDSVALETFSKALGWLFHATESAHELEQGYDQWTAAVVKTHNYGRDFAALRSLLPLELRYVGLVGPRARREQLLGDLLDTGITSFPNLFAPAGLDLGAESPEEVALSIVSEIQSVFADGSRQNLRDRKAPIHVHLSEPAGAAH